MLELLFELSAIGTGLCFLYIIASTFFGQESDEQEDFQ